MKPITTSTPPDRDALLKSLVKPKPQSKDREKTPSLTRPDLKDKTQELQLVLTQLKDLEAMKASLAADLAPVAEDGRVEHSRRDGECHSSIKLNGLLFVSQNKYAEVRTPEIVAKVERTFGPLFSRYFGRYYSVKVEVGKLPPEILLELFTNAYQPCYTVDVDVDKLSTDTLAALQKTGAEVTLTHKVAAAYHEDRTMNPELGAMAAQVPEVKPVSFFRM